MLFNFEIALTDPNLITLLGDTTNTLSARNAIAWIIYNNYPIQQQYITGINLIVLPPVISDSE